MKPLKCTRDEWRKAPSGVEAKQYTDRKPPRGWKALIRIYRYKKNKLKGVMKVPKKKTEFTKDELFEIEKIFDMNALDPAYIKFVSIITTIHPDASKETGKACKRN